MTGWEPEMGYYDDEKSVEEYVAMAEGVDGRELIDVLLHSLWYGDGEETFSGLRFVYYTEASFGQVVGDEYGVVESARYTEMEANDSVYFVLKKRA